MKITKKAYIINNIEYARVSTILSQIDKPALQQWSANCVVDYIKEKAKKADDLYIISEDELNKSKTARFKVSQKALDVGSMVHELIKKYIQSKIIGVDFDPTKFEKFDEKVENGFLAFLTWENENNIEWLESEVFLKDEINKIAGTCDVICRKNGDLCLIDFKTSKDFFPEYDLQVSIYKHMYQQERDITIDEIGILRLDKETGIADYRKSKDRIKAFFGLVTYFFNKG